MRVGPEFDEFVAGSGPRLLRTAALLAGNVTDGEDLLQVALLRTYRRWPVAKAAPAAYTTRVLVNLAHDRRRWWSRRPREVADVDTVAVAAPAFEEATIERDRLVRALVGLPERQRVVVVLRYIEDRPVAEVADLLTCSEGAVKALAQRALATLRTQLTDTLEVHHAQ